VIHTPGARAGPSATPGVLAVSGRSLQLVATPAAAAVRWYTKPARPAAVGPSTVVPVASRSAQRSPPLMMGAPRVRAPARSTTTLDARLRPHSASTSARLASRTTSSTSPRRNVVPAGKVYVCVGG
jgi:hypothetical protein